MSAPIAARGCSEPAAPAPRADRAVRAAADAVAASAIAIVAADAAAMAAVVDAAVRRRRPRRLGANTADDFQTGDFERFAGEIPEQGPESEQAGVVRAWYARVLELAKLQLEIRTEENETQIIVRLFGGDARLLTEEHGELLDALQVLGNKALVGRKVEKEIELDCEAFKERRAEQLAEKAQGARRSRAQRAAASNSFRR